MRADDQVVAEEKRHRGRDIVLILVGIVGLGVGAELMVRSAITIARGFGLSDMIIGMTVVALGTSLPELAAALPPAFLVESGDDAERLAILKTMRTHLRPGGVAAVEVGTPERAELERYDGCPTGSAVITGAGNLDTDEVAGIEQRHQRSSCQS